MIASRIIELRALAVDKALTRKDAQAAIVELCDAIQACQRKRPAAKGFSLSEVMAMAERRNWKPGAAEAFFDHYEMVGWVYGKCRHPIKKLSAAMSTWERAAKNGSAPIDKKHATSNSYGVE